ncbi:hypothetical protein GF324_02760 [bacterium]|nr:hypothetical protein [bacterium]
MRTLAVVLVAALTGWWSMGCIVLSAHQWDVRLNEDGTGSGTLVFHNLGCDEEDDSTYNADFKLLYEDYLLGDSLDADYPKLNITKRELFRETWDGEEVLSGKMSFTFSDVEDLGVYHYKPKNLYLYRPSESLQSSNGFFTGDETTPQVILWEDSERSFQLTTTTTSTIARSFLPKWKEIE